MTTAARPLLGVFRTLRGRMLFWILCVAVPIYAVSSWMSYRATAQRLEAQAERDADELVARLAAGLDAVIRPIEGGVRTVAAALEEIDPPREQYALRIRSILAAWPEVYGSTIAAESQSQPFAPYYYRGKQGLAYADLARDTYAYHQATWYRRAADSLQPAWSPPYFDTGGGNTWMVTYSVPYFSKQGDHRSLAGVVTADLDLNWVKKVAATVSPGPIGRGWIFSPPGQAPFVAPLGSPTERAAARPVAPGEDAIRAQGEQLYDSGRLFQLMPASTSGEATYVAVRNLDTLNWRLMLAIPRAQLLADARNLLNRQLVLGAVGLAGLIAAIFLVAAGISRPIRALAQSVGNIRGEEFDFTLPENTRTDEIGVLTGALRRMRDALKHHIHLRAESLAAEKRLGHELAFAATIQQSMLPAHHSGLPAAAQVHAALIPAKRVGGDLYDCFTARDGELLFVVGDVSDKGIPAALCMARLSSLLRLQGTTAKSPDRLLRDVNTRFGERNEACMFATVLCGLLDLHTGRLRYASAGHEPPLLREAGGLVRQLDVTSGPAIGVETRADYDLAERWLAPGDTVVLFTDGVTEAVAEDGSLFGIERLQDLLQEFAAPNPADLVGHITNAVTTHSTRFHATDDLTVLTVGFAPEGITASATEHGTGWVIQTPTTAEGIRETRKWLHVILTAREVSREQIGEAELIAEELLTNVVKAAGSNVNPVRLSLCCKITPTELVITVRDDGMPFNPLARPPVDLDADIADRDIGGLGIHMVQDLARSCRYEHVSGCNVLEVRLHRT